MPKQYPSCPLVLLSSLFKIWFLWLFCPDIACKPGPQGPFVQKMPANLGFPAQQHRDIPAVAGLQFGLAADVDFLDLELKTGGPGFQGRAHVFGAAGLLA